MLPSTAVLTPALAGKEVPIPAGLRLVLPERWTDDPGRCATAEVAARSNGEIALAGLDRLIDRPPLGSPRGC